MYNIKGQQKKIRFHHKNFFKIKGNLKLASAKPPPPILHELISRKEIPRIIHKAILCLLHFDVNHRTFLQTSHGERLSRHKTRIMFFLKRELQKKLKIIIKIKVKGIPPGRRHTFYREAFR